MNTPIKYRIKTPEVVYETIEGETVIVNLENGLYYSLRNQTGVDAWTLLEAGMDFPAMSASLAQHYAQDEQVVSSALRDFIILLQQEGLIEVDQRTHDSPVVSLAMPLKTHDGVFEPPSIERFSDMQDLLLLDPIHDVDEAGWPNLPKTSQDLPAD
jgi:hypothetical protein